MPEGWRSVVFGDVARIDIERAPVERDRTYPTAGVLNAGQGVFDRGLLSGQSTNYEAFHRLRANQVVMRKLTAWEGPVAVVPEEFDGFYVSTEFPTFSLDTNQILPDFMQLICQLPAFWDAMKLRSTGTVQRRKRLNPSALLTVPVSLPPLADQRRTVDLILSLDETLSASNRALDAATIAFAALADAVAFDRDAAKPQATKATIQEIALKRGLIGGPFGSSLGTRDYRESGVPVIRGTNMPKVGRFVAGDFVFVSPEKADTLRRNLAEPGDVIFTQRGTVGQVGLVPDGEFPQYIVSQSQMRLRVNCSKALPEYVYYVFRSSRIVDALISRITATANPHINLGTLAGVSIPLPPIDVQREIIALLGSVEGLVEALHGQQAALISLRSVLLPQLLSGEHVILDSYDQLLEATG